MHCAVVDLDDRVDLRYCRRNSWRLMAVVKEDTQRAGVKGEDAGWG